MMKTIYFDMDGVLVDLCSTVARFEGYDNQLQWHLEASTNKPSKDAYFEGIANHVDKGLFKVASPSNHLIDFRMIMSELRVEGYDVKLLSSCMDNEHSDKIRSQKLEWISTHLPEFDNNDIIIVNGSTKKIDHVQNDDLLIDDYLPTKKLFDQKNKSHNFYHYKSFVDFNEFITNIIEEGKQNV